MGIVPSHEEPRPRAGERRHLTVLFCDLVGSSRLTEQLDDEIWNEIVSAYHRTCEAVVRRFDAYVAEKPGDGLIAYFGWPVAHGDDAYRAVRTGLGIIDAMQTLNAQLEREQAVTLRVRIGIDTGTVVVGNVNEDRKEERATGSALNVASRLQGIAAPDTVVVSESTFNLVGPYFIHEDLGPQRLTNIATAVRAHRMIAQSAVEHRLEAAGNRGLTPLVGRESEVEELLNLWDRVAGGRSQVAFIKGEPGVGKSRLVKVVRQQIAHSIEFRCSPYDSHSALFPVVRHLERWLGLEQLENADKKLERLEHKVRELGFSVPDVVPLLVSQFRLALPGDWPEKLSSQKQRHQTLNILAEWLLKEAEQNPLMAVCEDLQWADPSTLEWLGLVIERAASADTPLLMLMTYRSDEFQPPWTGLASTIEIALRHLERPHVEEMIRRITSGRSLPLELVDQIVEKTDGVPLFVEELVQALIDSGFVRAEGDRFVMARPSALLAIPATLEDSLMSRLDRLGPAKAIAQRGAVLGRTFSQDLIRAVLDQDARDEGKGAEAWDHAERCLTQLVEAGVLLQGRTAPTIYEFKHALIQDAAYQSLLKKTRQAYHLQTARVLETEFVHITEAQPELVARHYTEAFQLDRALDYWQKAGERARDRSANREAIHHFAEGLEIIEKLPESEARDLRELGLLIAGITPLIAIKGYNADEAAATLNRALELGRKLGEVTRLFPALYGIWVNRLVDGKYKESLQLGEDFLREAENQDRAPRLIGHRLCGVSLFSLGDLSGASDHLQQSLTLYDRELHAGLKYQGFAQDPRGACEAFMSMVQWLRGCPDEAADWSRRSVEHAKEALHSNTWGYVYCFGRLTSEVFRRDVIDLERHASDLIEFSTKEKLPVWFAYASIFHGWALVHIHSVEDGIAEMKQGLADLDSLHMGFMKSLLLWLLADGYARLGRAEDGMAALDAAWSFAEATGEAFWMAEVQRLKGVLILRAAEGLPDGKCRDAEVCFQKAREIASCQGARALELRAAISLSQLWRAARPLEALEILQKAYEAFTEGLDTVDLLEARQVLDQLPA
jgi:class 3 adenylate cyclase/predicted ATPase